MKKRKGFILALFIILAFILSFYFDNQIVVYFSYIRNFFLTNFLMGLTFISSEAILFIFLTSLFLWQGQKRKWILPLWFTMAVSVAISFFLKIIVNRPRPFQTGLVSTFPILAKNSHLSWNLSFPSFHTMLVFSAIPLISKQFPRFKYIWITFASLIAISRVYFGLHFLSDVLVGGIIGYFLGLIILKMEEDNQFWEKILNKIKRKK